MIKYDVALYGNLVLDTFETGKEYNTHQYGGIGNIERHLRKINPSLNIKVLPFWKGYALFHTNRNATKLVDAHLNDMQFFQRPIEARWSHLSYANCVGDKVYSMRFNSMDVSPSGGRLKEITTDIAFRNRGYNPYHRDSFVWNYITHDEGGSILTTKEDNFVVRHPKLKLRFTVGAGDMLVAEVINAMLPDPDRPINEILRKCHSNVIKELKNEQADFTVAGRRKS
jgi:hypothetical protein